MSDTPRTNLEAFFPHDSMYQVCDADFVRKLERELNKANANVERLTKSNLQLREGCEEMKRRIKRLEDAGDRMRLFCADADDCFAWEKARGKAKP
jgi:predicted RNase H-like nuclease (RuvC/YqgF family)